MPIMSKKSCNKRVKVLGDRDKYFARIRKTLYYGKLPQTDVLSLPVTELAAEIFSEAHCGKTLERLHFSHAAQISRSACISPCSLILAILYLERLKSCNPQYLERTTPSDLFLVSLMVSSKFLFDDGECDEVFIDEWAASGDMSTKELVKLEKGFLNAIDWKIFVNETTFWHKLTDLETTIAKREGLNRGSFTYTELHCLLSGTDVHGLIQGVVALSAILIATYAIGFLTIVSSFYLVSRIPGTALQQQKPVEFKNEDVKGFMFEDDNNTDIEVRNLDPVCVLKTGFLLASIKSFEGDISDRNCTKMSDNVQEMSWDWWNVPTMTWLWDFSTHTKYYDTIEHNFFGYLFDVLRTYSIDSYQGKIIGEFNKATRTRIQDQIERKWHIEWDESIRKKNWFDVPFFIISEVKS